MSLSCDLTDEQSKILDPLIPKPRTRSDGRGRPWKSRRSVVNGILWVLRTGAPWADLPDRYPSFQTCHRRHKDLKLIAKGGIDMREAFIDASFAPAKKGDVRSERRNATREQRSWSLPIGTGCQFRSTWRAQHHMK